MTQRRELGFAQMGSGVANGFRDVRLPLSKRCREFSVLQPAGDSGSQKLIEQRKVCNKLASAKSSEIVL